MLHKFIPVFDPKIISETRARLGVPRIFLILTALIIFLFFCGVLFFNVEAKSVVRGYAVTKTPAQVITSPLAGVISAVYVAEGQKVSPGDVVLELNDSELSLRQAAAIKAFSATEDRIKVLEECIKVAKRFSDIKPGHEKVLFYKDKDSPADIYLAEMDSSLNLVMVEREKVVLEAGTLGAEATRLRRLGDIQKEHLKVLVNGENAGVVSQVQLLDKKKEIISNEADKDVLSRRLSEKTAEKRLLDEKVKNLAMSYMKSWQMELERLNEGFINQSKELKLIDRDLSLLKIRASVAGHIHSLSVFDSGEYVSAGRKFMEIVPESAAVEVNGLVSNRDRPFVQVGQLAKVKVDAYPFGTYGTLDGVVEDVGPDVTNRQMGEDLFYVKIKVKNPIFTINGKTYPLLAGMAVSAEVIAARRKLIDYLIGPVLEISSEAFSER